MGYPGRVGLASVGLIPKIPKDLQLLYFATGNFEQFRFQSIYVPIPKLKVPPDLKLEWSQTSTKIRQMHITPLRTPGKPYRVPGSKK